MNTPSLNTEKLKHLLNHSVQQLDETTLNALHDARQTALSKQHVCVAAASLSSGHHLNLSARTQKWLITALVSATLLGAWNVVQHQREQQINELDIAILSDEMPIEVFVD